MLFYLSYGAIWVLVILLFFAVFLLYRHFGRQLLEERQRLESEGPKIGEQLQVTLEAVDGTKVRISGDVHDAHVVVFTAPRCKACIQLQRNLLEAATTGDLRGVELVVIHHGDVESTKGYVHGMPATVRPVSDSARNLARLWQVRRTPYFVVTGPGGLVRGKGISLRGAESAYAVASGQQADGDSARWSRGSQMMVR